MERVNDRTQSRRMPGEEGVWVFIFGDMSVFGLFFIIFAYYYIQAPELYQASQRQLNQNLGALNTLLLLGSSWFVVMALNAYRKQLLALTRKLLMVAFALGAGFVAVKFIEYGEKISVGITLTTNDFFMFYFIYTGIHFLHVTLGMFVLIFLWSKAGRTDQPVEASDISTFECGAAYWHMVDLLWIVLFPLLYLVK